MRLLRFGKKPGVGTVVKMMRDSADDPFTTPNDAYGKFLFNSETAEIGYISDVKAQEYQIADALSSHVTPKYLPAGTDATDYYVRVAYNYASGYFVMQDYTFRSAWFGFDFTKVWSVEEKTTDWTNKYRSQILRYVVGTNVNNQYLFSANKHWPTITDASTAAAFQEFANCTDVIAGAAAPSWWMHFGDSGTNAYKVQAAPGEIPVTAITSAEGLRVRSDVGYQFDLPADDAAYPAYPALPPVDGQHVVRINTAGTIKIAKPGYTVDSPPGALIIDSDKPPVFVAASGVVTLAPGQTVEIPVTYPITVNSLVEYHVNETGQPVYLPSALASFAGSSTMVVEYRIENGSVFFRSQMATLTVDVTYVVFADDPEPQTSGTGFSSIRRVGSHIQIVRAGAAETPSNRDVLLDSRASYLPMVAFGWIPRASFVNRTSGSSRFPPHQAEVSFTNDGTWRPFVIARAVYENIGDATRRRITDFRLKVPYYFSSGGSASSFAAMLESTKVTLYANATLGTKYEDYFETGFNTPNLRTFDMNLVGARYYVFAVPLSFS